MMKRTLVSMMAMGVVAMIAGTAHAETKIAVLDVAEVFEQYLMTQDLETKFEEKRRAAADEAEQRKKDIESMRRALSAFDPASADFARREAEAMRAEIEFQVWSGQMERQLKGNHKRWLLKIYSNTRKTVAALAKERQIDLVLTYDELTEDAPDSVTLRQQILLQKVIFHDDRIDLTDEVVTRLNEAYRTAGGIRSLDELPSDKTSEPAPNKP